MCRVGNRRSRRVSNCRSRQYVNHYNNKWHMEIKLYEADDDVPVETVEVIGEETKTEKEQSVTIETCSVNPEAAWNFWKYAAIFTGIGLGLFLLGSKN